MLATWFTLTHLAAFVPLRIDTARRANVLDPQRVVPLAELLPVLGGCLLAAHQRPRFPE